MIKILIPFLFILFLMNCSNHKTEIHRLGKHYQQYHDYASLKKIVSLIPSGTDTAEITKALGSAINIDASDFRYIIDSTGVHGCVIGAVFHFDNKGKIDQKWIDEICE